MGVAAGQVCRPEREWFSRMEEAERGDGWLAWCKERGIYVAATAELADALASAIGGTPVLEVAAGDGMIAVALASRGVSITATDLRDGGLSCSAALARYRPRTVLSCFAPLDAGIEAQILRYSSVLEYLYIGPLVNGRPGPDALWREPAWTAEDCPEIERRLISRLDHLTDFTRATHRRGAGAVRLLRSR